MLKPSTAKNARRRNQARRSQRKSRPDESNLTTHQRAIKRLSLQLRAEEGLFCIFHGGVDWRCAQRLLPRKARFVVKAECPVWAGGRRYVPDLKVSCARTQRPLLLIEVWHSHAVNPTKRRAYNELGIPWVEVKSWHVLQRYRKRPLAILDWGGMGMPDAPCQGSLFADDLLGGTAASRKPRRTKRSPSWRASPGWMDSARAGRLFDELPLGRPMLCN